MGVGGITKMPLVVTDTRRRLYCHPLRREPDIGYDHRIIDGAVVDQFMAFVKKTLEGWSEDVG